MKLTATCFTEKHGIHKVQINSDIDGNTPDFVAVKILNTNNDLKFDPRKEDWDAWVQAPMGQIPSIDIVTKRLVGTIYMENLPIKKQTASSIIHYAGQIVKFGTYGHVTIGKL